MAQEAMKPPPALSTAGEIRRLSAEEALQHRPVRLTATVTLVEQGRTVFVQDATGGTFVSMRGVVRPDIVSGQRVYVEGVTHAGLYVPGIELERIKAIGPGDFPEPEPVTFAQLESGRWNYQWVEAKGILRGVEPSSGGGATLLLAMGDGRLEIYAPMASPEEVAALVDAEVRVQGLAAGFINARRQLIAPHLRLRTLEDVRVDRPAPDAAALPVIPASKLLQYSTAEMPEHRVKVRGVVTHQQPGRALFLRDGGQGLLVETRDARRFQPGDAVEALGFPAMGRFSALLQESEVQVTGRETEPVPVATSVKEILNGDRDAELVSVEAQLLKALSGAGGEATLVMQTGETVFDAQLAGDSDAAAGSLRAGSTLRLTGVCMLGPSESQPRGFRLKPRSFELLLRGPGDVAVIRASSWWTKQRLGAAAALLLAVAAAALMWGLLLRRQVRRQMLLIREKVEGEAITEERQRIAREFHDTLEQELVGLSLRLDALASRVTERKPRELLDAARRLVQRLQSEARGFVWDLRSHAAGAGNLPAAILNATRAIQEQGVAVKVDMEGESRRLPARLEHTLIRVAQEAATNGVKHGKAREIRVRIEYAPESVALRVADDGAGFDPDQTHAPGHFGLTGMRERLGKVDGSFDIESRPGAGAVVSATIPLPAGMEAREP